MRNFSITVTDTTRHIAYQNLDVKTNAAVPLLNIVRQGGVEVEDTIPSTCLVTLPLFGTCLLSKTGGLADYPTPIQLRMTVTPGNDQMGATGWAYLRWQNRYAGVLLQNTPASPDVTSNQDFQATATFRRPGCARPDPYSTSRGPEGEILRGLLRTCRSTPCSSR